MKRIFLTLALLFSVFTIDAVLVPQGVHASGASFNITTHRGEALALEIKQVFSLADFPTPVANVITLDPLIAYQINTSIDYSPNTIEFTGANAIFATNPFVHSLTSDTAGSCFSGEDDTSFFQTLTLSCANGILFDFKNSVGNEKTSFFSANNVVMLSANKIARFENLFVVSFFTVGGVGILDNGIEFVGSQSGEFAASFFNAGSALTVNGTLFDFGTSVFDIINITNSPYNSTGANTWISGATNNGNMTAGNIAHVTHNSIVGPTPPIVGIDPKKDDQWFFFDNTNVENSQVDDQQASAFAYNELDTYTVGQTTYVLGIPFTNKVAVTIPENFDPSKWTCLDRGLKTGVLSGGIISISGGGTTFDITAMTGIVVDNSDPNNYLVTPINFPETLNIANTNLGTGTSQILIDVTGTVIQLAIRTIDDELNNISLGRTSNSGGLATNPVQEQKTAYSIAKTTQALFASIGGQSIVSTIFEPGATGLTVNTPNDSKILSQGRNFPTDPDNPDIADVLGESPVIAAHFFRTFITDNNATFNINSPLINEVDNSLYNPGGDTLIAVPAGKFQVQRVYTFGGSSIHVFYYGRTLYDTLEEAQQSFDSSDEFQEHSVTSPGAFSAFVIIQEGITDWSDPSTFQIINRTGGIVGSFDRGIPSGGIGGLTVVQKQSVISSKSTGVFSGGGLSGTVGLTTFNIASGTGQVIDNTVPGTTTEDQYEWDAFAAVPLTELATAKHTFIFLQRTAGVVSIVQIGDNSVITEIDRKNKLYLGVIRHGTGTFVGAITQPQTVASPVNKLIDLYIATGKTRSASGNQIVATGAGLLTVNKELGKSYGIGINAFNDGNNTDFKDNPAIVAAVMLKYSSVGHIDGATITNVDTSRFDPNGATTDAELVALVGGSTFVAHRIWIEAVTNTVIFQYGQVSYSSEDDAIANFVQEDLSLPTGLNESSYLREVIVVINGAANLDTAKFIPVIGGGGTAGTIVPTNIVDNLLSTDPNSALSANQGRVLSLAHETLAETLVEGNTTGGFSIVVSPDDEVVFANSTDNRKVVLFESANNDHQFYGFGIIPGALRYQVDNPSSDHVWFAGTGATTSDQLAILTGDGNLGIDTSSPPITRVQVNSKIIDDNLKVYDSSALMIVNQTPTSNTIINDPQPVLYLGRQGTTGESLGALATFKMSRFEDVGLFSRSRLDLSMAHNSFDDINIASWFSNGDYDIEGDFRIGGAIAMSFTGLGTNVVNSSLTNLGVLSSLEISGQIKITGGSPGVNKVLTSDAVGLATWADPSNISNTNITLTSPRTFNLDSNIFFLTDLPTANTMLVFDPLVNTVIGFAGNNLRIDAGGIELDFDGFNADLELDGNSGTAGQVITSAGLDLAPTWEIAPNISNTNLNLDDARTLNLLTHPFLITSGAAVGLNPLMQFDPGVKWLVNYAGNNIEVNGTGIDLNFIVSGDLELNNDAGTAGQVLTSNGIGVPPTWSTAISVSGNGIETSTDGIEMTFSVTSDLQISGDAGAVGYALISKGANLPPVWEAPANIANSNLTLDATRILDINTNTFTIVSGANPASITVNPTPLTGYVTLFSEGNEIRVFNDGILFDFDPTDDLSIDGSAGTAGQFLSSNGPNLPPTWETGGGGLDPNSYISINGTDAGVADGVTPILSSAGFGNNYNVLPLVDVDLERTNDPSGMITGNTLDIKVAGVYDISWSYFETIGGFSYGYIVVNGVTIASGRAGRDLNGQVSTTRTTVSLIVGDKIEFASTIAITADALRKPSVFLNQIR